MDRKQIAVEELRLGMYVTELDRPWLGTPFPFQGFPVMSAHQIDELKQYCKTVFIDLERDTSDDSRAGHELTEASLLGPVVYATVTSVEKELAAARAAYSALDESIQKAFDRLREGGELDLDALKGPVRSMTRSIERNPDAMMLLSRIRQKSDQEFSRAVDTLIHMIAFGRFLQFPGERLLLLGLAGLLLNVGKIQLPDTILQKKEALTAEEFALVKMHVMHSVELVRAAPRLSSSLLEDVVIQHHERLDGSGYPQGLRGRQISVDGAIAGLVDSYSALTSVRPYAEQVSSTTALETLHKVRGTLFSELLVEKFIQCTGVYPVGSTVEFNSGEIGIVIAQNLELRLRPRVMLLRDADLQPIRPPVILDLVKEPRTTPGEPYRIVRTLPRHSLPFNPEEFL